MEHPGLAVDLANFEGYEGLAAFRDDAKMDTAHRNDFARIAVVGDRKWNGERISRMKAAHLLPLLTVPQIAAIG